MSNAQSFYQKDDEDTEGHFLHSNDWKSSQGIYETPHTIDYHVSRLKKICAQMIGYNEGQVLELFKSTLHTRYYYLWLGIQNLSFERSKGRGRGKFR